MEDKIKKVEDDIEKVSKTIEGLLALQEADKASFVLSGKAATLQYWQDEKLSLRRKEELLLLQMSQRESSVPAPPGNSITLPQVLPLSSIPSFLSSPSFFRNS